jgi:hypothetical protein
MLPLLVIGVIAFLFLSLRREKPARLRVTTSIPGAEIMVDGSQTGYSSDTTLPVTPGRRIITVRKENYISDPEFVVLDLKKRTLSEVRFVLKNSGDITSRDSIAPLRPVRQEIFSTGQPVRSVPPAGSRGHRLIDYSSRDEDDVSRKPNQTDDIIAQPMASDPSVVNSSASPLNGTQITVTSVPDKADIIVNGAAAGRSTPYAFRGLDRGVYVFRARMEGYIAKPESIVVSLSSDYQSELAAFELSPDPNAPRPALTIITEPLAAGFRVDGRPSGIGRTTLDPGFGTHKVEFNDVPGYRTPSPVTVSITAEQPHADAVGQYEKLVGNAYLALIPSEEIEKFDGSQVRVFIDNELILDSPKQRYGSALMGKIVAGRHLVRIQYGDLSSDLTTTLLDGQVSEITFRIESFFSKRKLRLKEKNEIPVEEWQQKNRKLGILSAS